MSNGAELVNRAFRVILLGIEEVVGKNGMASVLRIAGLPQYINNYPPSDLEYGGHLTQYASRINHAVYDLYGARGARAILTRIGRGRARNAIEENAAFANAIKLAISFLPRRTKVKLALDRVSKEYSRQMGTTVRVYEDSGSFYWEDPLCGCAEWPSPAPVCYTTAGFIHGFLAWGLDDEDFRVSEVACRAMADAVCKYRIALEL